MGVGDLFEADVFAPHATFPDVAALGEMQLSGNGLTLTLRIDAAHVNDLHVPYLRRSDGVCDGRAASPAIRPTYEEVRSTWNNR